MTLRNYLGAAMLASLPISLFLFLVFKVMGLWNAVIVFSIVGVMLLYIWVAMELLTS